MRWLHISDLHIGRSNQGQAVALALMVEEIGRVVNGCSLDAIIISGDLAYSGLSSQYDELSRSLLSTLRHLPECAESELVCVPGNHDVNCDIGTRISWEGLSDGQREKFFYTDEAGATTRLFAAQRFQNYGAFLNKCGANGIDPTREALKPVEITKNGRKFALLTLNTAFFCNAGQGERGRIPAPLHPLHEWFSRPGNFDTVLIVGHHPVSWFSGDSEPHFRSLLTSREAVYLHGHEHTVQVAHGKKGLTQFGFGASYQASPHSPASGVYRNSFAICEIDDAFHVAPYSWDSQHGKWQPDPLLPSDFCERSERLRDGYKFALPTTKVSDVGEPAVSQMFRKHPPIKGVLWVDADSKEMWPQLLESLGQIHGIGRTIGLPYAGPESHIHLAIEDSQGRHLIKAVSAPGDVISVEQVRDLAIEIDLESYTSGIIITLGKLDESANTLAVRLSKKKPLKIIDGEELAESLYERCTPELKEALAALDPLACAFVFLVVKSGIGLLVTDNLRSASFFVLSPLGEYQLESSELIRKVRDLQPDLDQVQYQPRKDQLQVEAGGRSMQGPKFSKESYLNDCAERFSNVRYAPLAAIGIRYSDAALKDLYVPTQADLGGNSKHAESIARTIKDFIEEMDLEPQLKQQYESQLLSLYGARTTQEAGAASRLYQKYGNVVVLGDPGSGKSCFVQHEILSYCKNDGGTSWYSHHIPIFVPLAEAANLLDSKLSFPEIISTVTARRQLSLPAAAIEHELAAGKVALFFDGLDEVGQIDQRIQLMELISDYVNRFGRLGNRFVLTSRPAAVQPVAIPAQFTYLQLKGLTDYEIRTLAERVLVILVSGDTRRELASDEKKLVDQILNDCNSTPGIRRLARNPLLLTLLVMIYANSGRPAAKRHVIYSQAVKTLVVVRHRDSRTKVLSETDLRHRLGATAYAIYRRAIGEIPTREEVIKVMSPLFGEAGVSDGNIKDTCDQFIQEVAEITGLFLIHSSNTNHSDDLISFMHHSFLEYYAAVGLLDRDYVSEAADLALHPKWQGVLTLMFGIIGDKGDISEPLSKVLVAESANEHVTLSRLLFALDCVLENDSAPPERVQRNLANSLREILRSGAGLHLGSARDALAVRIGALLETTQSAPIESVIVEAMSSPEDRACAAAIDLVSRIGTVLVTINQDVLPAFSKALQRKAPVVRTAALIAIRRIELFRTEEAIDVLEESLATSKSFPEKHAALRALEAAPALSDSLGHAAAKLVMDRNLFIAGAAARAILGMSIHEDKGRVPDSTIGRALAVWHQAPQADTSRKMTLPIKKDYIDELIESEDLDKTILGIRYTALLKDDGEYAHTRVLRVIRSSSDHRVVGAGLQAMRLNRSALDIFTLSDVDYVVGCLSEDHGDIRIEAARLLAELPTAEQIVEPLQRRFQQKDKLRLHRKEVREIVNALVRHVRKDADLRIYLLDAVESCVEEILDSGVGRREKQLESRGLIAICSRIGGVVSTRFSDKLYVVATSYKVPTAIRAKALEGFGALAVPNPENVGKIMKRLIQQRPEERAAAVAATHAIMEQSRRRVEYTRAIQSSLAGLESALLRAWDSHRNAVLDRIDDTVLREIRETLILIERARSAFSEFSGRTFDGSAVQLPSCVE